MSEIRFDVVGLGNAIVDVMSKTDDVFLEHWGIHKNAMNLIEEDRAEALTKAAIEPFYTSGGSGANTIAGLASFGARAAYIGKVAKDELGSQFTREMSATGVPFATTPLESGPATARSIIFGHRSCSPRRTSTKRRSAPAASSILKAICLTAKMPRKPSSLPPKSPRRQAGKWR